MLPWQALGICLVSFPPPDRNRGQAPAGIQTKITLFIFKNVIIDLDPRLHGDDKFI